MRVQDRTPECLGPYRLVRRLGEGGMGVVYLALDASDVQVALKALHPGLAQEPNARRRMGREVETMQRVRSRFVAEVLDADLDGDPPYIVTRYVPGLSLDEVVGTSGQLTGPALARLAYGLAEALAAVHAAGVVHRDLKPGNVMISDGQPVVIDFGIAQVPETTRLTMTGMFMGTPGYLAPEVIEGKDSGNASDVHSWAATVAYAATGRPPYGTGPFETIFYRIVHGTPNLDTLPEPLRPIVVDALARDPAQRPSAAEVGQRIAALDPETLIPSPPAAVERLASGPAYGIPGPAATLGDGPDWAGWPATTKPLTASRSPAGE
ncbi:MAG TPA: serine/threonine-protein kinase, partial [Streptosporangiaceae bacterium]